MDATLVVIGVLGSFASIIGAIISIRSGRKAKSAAEKVEIVKNQIFKKQKTSYLVNLFYKAKHIQRVFGKYSIAKSNRSLAGVEFEKDSQIFQEFVFEFNENRQLINENTEINTEDVYKLQNSLLKKFSEAQNIKTKKEIGNQIRLSIDDILFKIKKVIEIRNTEII